MKNCIFIIGFGKITLQQKQVVLAKKKAVKSRRKKNLYNEFVDPIKSYRIRLQ